MTKICGVPTPISKMANAANLEVSPTIDGRYKITSRAKGAKVGTVSTVDEAREIINNFVGLGMPDLDAGIAIPLRGTPLSQNALPQQSQLSGVREAISLFQVGPTASLLTPAEKFMQAVERLGKGPAFTKIYEPTQAAKRAFSDAIAGTLIPRLAGMFGVKKGKNNYQDTIKQLDKLTKDLPPEQRRLITLMGEAFTKEELAKPGVLLQDGLTQETIDFADTIASWDLADEIPLMIRRNAIIEDFLANRQRMVEIEIPKMKNAILEGRLPKEFTSEIEGILQHAGTETTVDDLFKIMGLSGEEVAAMKLLRAAINDETINIPAGFRYAQAPKANPKYKNGREQFAAERGMTPQAVKLANDRMTVIEEVFKGSGTSASQVVGAQYPIFREFISAGVLPGKQFRSSKGGVKKWASVLEQLPEGDEILKRRVLSGHLDPHELNPSVSALRHVRNMLLREHFDPVMPDALKQMHKIAEGQDERVGKIIQNYLHELEGVPTQSFKDLTAGIRTVARFANIQVDDKVAERLVDTLNFLTYSASIPFRIGLIARNYFQTTLAIPIVGGEAWYAGVKSALGKTADGFSPEAHVAAMNRAIKGGALKTNVIPLHGGSEAIGGVSESLFGQMRSDFAKVGFKVRELFDKGFTAYRNGDDFGRVVAFEAGRFRVNKHLTQFMKDQDLEKFVINSKVRTFDEVVEQEFIRLVEGGNYSGAGDLIGRKLADKVHFLYGDANHPSAWGSVPGRLFGQFGTFPTQYANHVLESVSRGTFTDKAEFVAYHSAINLGIIAAGAEVFGADLTSWAFYPSLQYTGGPYAELALSAMAAYGGSDSEKALARRNLQMMFPSWNRASIFVPGSYFLSDLAKSLNEDNFLQGIGRASGVRFLHDDDVVNSDLYNNVKAGFGWVNEIF